MIKMNHPIEMTPKKRILTVFLLVLAYSLWMFEPGGRVYWPFLISAYAMALIAFYDRGIAPKKAIPTFFSPKVWLHDTALNEALVVIMTFFLSFYVFDKLHLLSPVFFNTLFMDAIAYFDVPKISETPTLTASIIYIIASFMALDFGYFLAHYLMHKYTFLWEFHKVHHSAQVMTPLTSLRQHPMEILFNRIIRLLFLGVVNGAFFYLYPFYPTITVIASTNAALFLFLFFGSALGHSNVWISFGKLEKYIISPAMHQIHHSTTPKHFNKNFGLALTIWDRMFGTAYLTPTYEEIEFGLGVEDKKFLTLNNLIFTPFKRSYRKIIRKKKVVKT